MSRKLFGFLAVFAMAVFMSANAFAQSERNASAVSEMYVISAKAGAVNFTEGKVAVARNDSRSGYLLKGDRLEIGEKVSTGNQGRAEILLNPGSFVRLGENTEFEFVSTSLDDLKLKVTRGSAVFELIADKEFAVAVATPKGGFKAVESGIYRVDVEADGSGKLFVYGGKATVSEAKTGVVKKGRTATLNGGNALIEKFDRDDRDALDIWSKSRAKELAKVNDKLKRDDLRGSLLNSYNSRGWGFNDSFGLWVFDRFSGQYCFLPFGYGWGSPYGYYYGRDLWYFRMPRYVNYYPPIRNPGGSNNPGNNPGNNPNTGGSEIRNGRSSQPPFTRINPGVVRESPVYTQTESAPIRRPVGPPLVIAPGNRTTKTP